VICQPRGDGRLSCDARYYNYNGIYTANSSSKSLSVMCIFGARNFFSEFRYMTKEPALETGARKSGVDYGEAGARFTYNYTPEGCMYVVM